MSEETSYLTSETEPERLVSRLCAHFYSKGWLPGTGGGLAIKDNLDRMLVTPSGVPKEEIRAEDVFTMSSCGETFACPNPNQLKASDCAPLFLLAFELRNVKAVLHSHHISTSVLTQMIEGNEFRYLF
jgi:ribulose-5-phosphate 4-epimerase/fuculose-1-phosphate aldolase